MTLRHAAAQPKAIFGGNSKFLLWLTVFSANAFITPSAFSDPVDTATYFLGSRWYERYSTEDAVTLIAILMLANYAANFVVIGLPSIKAGPATMRSVSVDLILYTVLAQLADRLGALVAMFAAPWFKEVFGFWGFHVFLAAPIAEQYHWGWRALVTNFVVSGSAIGVLALFFVGRRWRLPKRDAWLLASVASILTNPVWLIWYR
ncbi:MAG TPA: hypothetical protein VMU16_09545 [Candidatus Binataceae bacterium]|nr:hypothetical protein [Candidatus Binataceae bacterium]